jgi:hypothetical protein
MKCRMITNHQASHKFRIQKERRKASASVGVTGRGLDAAIF